MKHSENTDYLPVFIAKMQSEGLPSPVIDTFAYYFNQLIQGETGLVYDRDIRPVDPDEIEQFHNLGNYAAAGIENDFDIWINGSYHGRRNGVLEYRKMENIINAKRMVYGPGHHTCHAHSAYWQSPFDRA